jgi:hypothetical protein
MAQDHRTLGREEKKDVIYIEYIEQMEINEKDQQKVAFKKQFEEWIQPKGVKNIDTGIEED